MKYCSIGNQIVRLAGKGLKHLPNFSPFITTDCGQSPLLEIDFGKMLRDWDWVPQYRLQNGLFSCDFNYWQDVYLLRIQSEADSLFLMEIHCRDNTFHALTNIDEDSEGFHLKFAIWVAFGVAALHRQTVSFHASTIQYGGKAVLFLGESGTGKSTHTRLWLDHIAGTELLNDDNPFVSANPKEVFAYGSPWSGKTPCYKNERYPIAAIVRLSQAPFNKMTRLGKIAAFGALLPSCPPVFAYNETLSDCMHEIISNVIMQAPVYSLSCLPAPSAAELVFSTLTKDGFL
jgi:hypothetical protein